MTCVYPECAGSLHTGSSAAYCLLCRLPTTRCTACQGINRTSARFCRRCGVALETEPEPTPPGAAAWEREPAVSQVDDTLLTAPQSALGFLWALGQEGSLYRINPFEVSGRQVTEQTRLWKGKQNHAFTVRRLARQSGLEEPCAVVAIASSLMIWGLVSQRLDIFAALLEGESILCDARSAYQLVAASGQDVFCLARRGEAASLLRISLTTMTATRYPIPPPEGHLCGPVWVDGTVVVWSERALWTLGGDGLVRREAPAGVTLWTGPSEDGIVTLPLGRSPAIAHGARLYLPCLQQGGPALLLAQGGGAHWALSVIPVSRPGTLVEDLDGNPLFANDETLAVCRGGGFRPEVTDRELSARFAAFHRKGLSLFFCEGNYGNGTQQWLRAHVEEQPRSVAWQLAPNRRIKECSGFWPCPGGMTAQMLIEDRFVRTEFVSWHD